MSYPNIKGIFFDVGWTMMRPVCEHWFTNIKLNEYADADILESISTERFHSAFFGEAYKYLDDNHLIGTEEEEYQQFCIYYRMVAEQLPELCFTQNKIDEIAYSKVYDMNNYSFFEDIIPTLEALRPKYKLGVISDTWPSITRMLKHGGIYDYFDCFTFSCSLGIFKPDRRMYDDALGKLGLPANETIFIDDVEANLDGAVKCGINPVLITVRPDAVNSGKYPSIEKISDILKLV